MGLLAGFSGTPVSTTNIAPASDEYASVVLSDGPIIYWRFGEVSGQIAFDSSGNGRDATYRNSPRLGVEGGIVNDADTAVEFNGVNEYEGWTPAETHAGTFTVEAWVTVSRSAQEGTGHLDILNSRYGSGFRDYSFDIKLEHSFDWGYGVRIGIGDGTQWFVTETIPFTWRLLTWYYVVATVDTQGVTIYLDGNVIGSFSFSGTPLLFDPLHPIMVATYRANGVEWFDGRIDEVAIYDYVLTSDQVTAHYQAGVSP